MVVIVDIVKDNRSSSCRSDSIDMHLVDGVDATLSRMTRVVAKVAVEAVAAGHSENQKKHSAIKIMM